jgi:hypothetical protein
MELCDRIRRIKACGKKLNMGILGCAKIAKKYDSIFSQAKIMEASIIFNRTNSLILINKI